MTGFIDISNKSMCCGCRACEQVCPVHCITMSEETEGFIVPSRAHDKCIGCGKCSKVCPIQAPLNGNNPLFTYAAVISDKDRLMESSSGGIFYSLASEIIKEKGAVIGAAFDKNFFLNHVFANTKDELTELMGSKYVQSNVGSVYSEIKTELNKGRQILFVGTPCQCAGLRNYLVRSYDNLLICDLVCHGVPSHRMFHAYVRSLEQRHHGVLTKLNFRDKVKYGWSITLSYQITRNKKSKTYYVPAGLSPYFYAFLRGKTLRESCYKCPYAKTSRVGDITLADFWGVEKAIKNTKFENGCSCVMVNTPVGTKAFETLEGLAYLLEVSVQDAVNGNVNLLEPCARDSARENIYKELSTKGFNYIRKKYCTNPNRLSRRIKTTIKLLCKKVGV